MKNFLKNKTLLTVFTMLLFGFLMTNCSNNDDDEVATVKAKFEVTGNFTGKLMVLMTETSDLGGTSGSADVSALPWSKEVDVKGRTSLGVGVNSDLLTPGLAGQKIVVKMFYNGKEVKSTTATADAEGNIRTETLAFVSQ